MASCPHCGGEVSTDSRFCPHCGRRQGSETASTAVHEPPPHETGVVPVRRLTATPDYFGVTPPVALLTLGVAALAVAVLLLVLGYTVLGLVLLAAGALFLGVFVRIGRRKRDSHVARASAEAVDAVRARTGFAATALSTRFDARRELRRLARERSAIEAERERVLRDLGDAVYRGLEHRAGFLTARLRELEDAAAGVEAGAARVTTEAQERLRRARLEVQPTELVGKGEAAALRESGGDAIPVEKPGED